MTPSARVLADMRTDGIGFFHFAMKRARGHKEYFEALACLDSERHALYANEAAESLARQAEIEASDTMDFDEYLAQYFSEQGCCN
jgi:glutamate--cysteine ligase